MHQAALHFFSSISPPKSSSGVGVKKSVTIVALKTVNKKSATKSILISCTKPHSSKTELTDFFVTGSWLYP